MIRPLRRRRALAAPVLALAAALATGAVAARAADPEAGPPSSRFT